MACSSSDREQTDPVKRQVAAHWDRRAAHFDEDFGHSIRTAAERAWDRILDLILLGGDALEALGTGFLSLELAFRGYRVTGIDFASSMIAQARKKAAERHAVIRYEEADAEQLPFAAASFDIAVSRHLLWTLPHPERAMDEWVRVLRPSGRLIIVSPAAPEQWDLTFSGVYRVTPDLGTISLLIGDFILPNGLAFSPDESVLYNNDTRRGHIRAFDLMPNGTLAKQTDRVFVDLRGSEPGVPDGMKVDVEGNVYCGGAGGLWIMDPHGKKLGRIVHGAPATTNLAFGGDDWKTLYFTSRNHLGAINVKISGVPVPPQQK